MPVNTLSFNQLSTVLAEITSQATGSRVIAPVNTADFVSVATTALLTGYDPLVTAISQVLSKTIFSIRPYYRKFNGLMVDEIAYGNHVRKLSPVDKPFEDDDRLTLVDGQSVDQYKVNKPKALQTNFYGQNVYQKSTTIYKDQLDVAFTGPEEFGRFLSMQMGNISDMIEQAHENTNRATLLNLIAGVISYGGKQTIHLLTEYNDLTGLTLTPDSVNEPDNYAPFIRWVYARIATLSDMLTERSSLFHQNVTGSVVMRHTPKADQRLFLLSPYMRRMDSSVLSMTFHDNYLDMGFKELVNFWQNIETPYGISATPCTMLADGTLTTADDPVVQSMVLGVLIDRETAGVTVVNQWSASTPFNARGGYSNMYWHFTDRYWNDFTENGVVLLLD